MHYFCCVYRLKTRASSCGSVSCDIAGTTRRRTASRTFAMPPSSMLTSTWAISRVLSSRLSPIGNLFYTISQLFSVVFFIII